MVFCASSLLGLAPARAEDPFEEKPHGPAELPRAHIRVIAEREHYARLRTALAEGSTRSFDVRWTHTHDTEFDPRVLFASPGPPDLALRCWVDLRDPRRARLYFSRGLTDRYLVRTLPLSGRFNEMDQEALAQIIELGLRALNEDETFGMSREEARSILETNQRGESTSTSTPQPPESPEPGRDAPTTVLRPGAYYFIGAHSLEVPITHGPGALLGLWHTRERQRAKLQVSVRYELPQEYSDTRIALGFSALAARLEGEFLGAIDPPGDEGRAYFGLKLGVGHDLVLLRPRAAPGEPSYQPDEPRLARAWVISGSLVGMVRWGRRASLFAAMGAEFDPARVHYDLLDGASRTVVIDRLRVRPACVLGVSAW